MARPHSEAYRYVFEVLKLKFDSPSSKLWEEFYPLFGHMEYNNFKCLVSRARHDLFNSLVNELCNFYTNNSFSKLSLPEINFLLFNFISTSISEAYHSEDRLFILTHFFLVLCNNRLISSLNSVFSVRFSVHSGGSVGSHTKLKHYSFDIPWSYFGVNRACRVDLGSTLNNDKSLSPRYVIFDKSKGHDHKPHVECDSLDTFIHVFRKRLQGYSGLDLWKELNGKIHYWTGRPRRTREEQWKAYFKKYPRLKKEYL